MENITYWRWGKRLLSVKEFCVLTVTLFLQIFLRNESHRWGIHAVAEPRRFGTVRKNMAKVGAAMPASHLGAHREEASILPFHDIPRFKGLREARPSGSRILFIL